MLEHGRAMTELQSPFHQSQGTTDEVLGAVACCHEKTIVVMRQLQLQMTDTHTPMIQLCGVIKARDVSLRLLPASFINLKLTLHCLVHVFKASQTVNFRDAFSATARHSVELELHTNKGTVGLWEVGIV